RVDKARKIQLERFGSFNKNKIYSNSKMSVLQANKFCKLSPPCEALLREAFNRLNLSARAHGRILRVARTIADLEGSENIEVDHINEAIMYRTIDMI
ncbi:MAG: magnesium chelatase, partial [Firmicutes bacterium]|nr:magnesium chelatase [Bacillota bacterium]